jgi:hypothetical protein
MDIATKRFCVAMEPLLCPSTTAVPAVYRALNPSKFDFHRPPKPEAIPLALLHPIFSRFAENAESHQPTAEDIALIQNLRSTLSQTEEKEAKTAEAIRSAFNRYYKIRLYAATVGATARQTDGHIMNDSYMPVVLEVKRFSGQGDPAVQGALYILEAIRPILEQRLDPFDLLPCIVIHVTGRCSFIIP